MTIRANREKLLDAIASVLSVDHWKTSTEISDELRSRYSFDLSLQQIRRLLRKQDFVERKKFCGYRSKSRKPDYLDQAILISIKANLNGASVAKKFKVSRQAINQRKQKLLKRKAICS